MSFTFKGLFLTAGVTIGICITLDYVMSFSTVVPFLKLG